MRNPDLRVYAILDPQHCAGRDPIELLGKAIGGGATLVQFRAKTMTIGDSIVLVRKALAVCEDAGVPLLVNDRVDVALAAGAQGVHLGQTDMALEDARRLLGPDAMIGVTAHHKSEAMAIDQGLADYAGVGPIFQTKSKDPGDPPMGPEGIRRFRRDLGDFPICGIAGIHFENAASVIEAGADGIAVISEIFKADDVAASTARLRRIVDAALAGESVSS